MKEIRPMKEPLSDSELEERFPWIRWREPALVSVVGGPADRLACRLCVARGGLRAVEVVNLPATRVEFDAHMREAHGH